MDIAHGKGKNDLMITRTLELVMFLRLLREMIIWYKYGDNDAGRMGLATFVHSGCIQLFRRMRSSLLEEANKRYVLSSEKKIMSYVKK